ncbi:MAG: hypothetical protein EPN74_14410 [Rhodanobacter sp.]|nr:MAG: hypothetical protein EPN74_14410 [Rhodanobacter sp.]
MSAQPLHTPFDNSRLRFPPVRIAACLRQLDRSKLTRTRAAASALVECLCEFLDAGDSPLAAVVGRDRAPRAWHAYQAEDATALNGTRGDLHYYYHSHDTPGAPAVEHGHFHLFAQLGNDAGGEPRYTHLVAIGVDARGMPQRLFTTNRWVTDETWWPGAELIPICEEMANAGCTDDPPVERWLRAQLGVFAPQIAELIGHRDCRMEARLAGGHRPGLLEDRRMHVISQCRISVEQQLTALEHLVH